MSFFPRKDIKSDSDEEEEGEILSSESEIENQPNDERPDDIYDSASSEQDRDRQAQEQKKRQEFWKAQQQSKPEILNNEENLLELAFEAAAKTNKRSLVLRKKNFKRIQQLQNRRIIQQPSLFGSNTHFRSSINEYPLMTVDGSGKSYIHPNKSLLVSECTLSQFIQKNINEEGTSNYLNEVVKFQNFAYQHRKKRRQNFQ